jgi:hypothetical protein
VQLQLGGQLLLAGAQLAGNVAALPQRLPVALGQKLLAVVQILLETLERGLLSAKFVLALLERGLLLLQRGGLLLADLFRSGQVRLP